MYSDSSLKTYLDTSSSINGQSLIIAEWNLNSIDNILTIGNYYHTPTSTPYAGSIGTSFSLEDSSTQNPKYYGATDSYISFVNGYDSNEVAQSFVSQSLRNQFLFSLSDCFNKFRPRSGINKLVYFSNKYIAPLTSNITDRPRYYLADKSDKFKYWTSSRTVVSNSQTVEKGISKTDGNATPKYYITDAAPFVVYKNKIPTNRIVTKIQTNIGTAQSNIFQNSSGIISDPFYGNSNATVPVIWRIDYLDPSSNNWINLMTFNSSTVFAEDGYLELEYGITNIKDFLLSYSISNSIINFAGEYSDPALLPVSSIDGYTYFVPSPSNNDAGYFYVWYQGKYFTFQPTYGWYVKDAVENNLNSYISDFTDPAKFGLGSNIQYREFQYIKGLRIVVDTMNKDDISFDLIELSPRLAGNLTDKTKGFKISRSASDIGSSGIPVGQLLAATGNLDLFDYDLAFSKHNKKSILNVLDSNNSIVTNFATKNLQLKFFDLIFDNNNISHVVPIKTMYAEGFPQLNNKDRSLSISMRDMYFYLESITAPEILVANQYFSYAVAVLLDSIGFTNYKFYRVPGEVDQVIPYFFVGPNTSVAQVLSDLATSTQTAMFFDENNNLIFMSKDYMMPTSDQRSTDTTLYGSVDYQSSGVYQNQATNSNLANIIELASENSDIFNDGKINYTTRYIQRTTGTIAEQSLSTIDQNWMYKPVLLWEISPTENVRSINDEISNQSNYSLSAIALNSDLSAELPKVVNGVIKNNTMDFGESVYWLSRYNGYFYANGEIIRFDAVQYSITSKSIVSGLQATLVSGSKTVTLTSGNTSGLSVGQQVTFNTSGTGAFGDGATIVSIINSTTFTVSIAHKTSGAITFSTSSVSNVWISSVQEYQKYFAQIPFNGKMYPTGLVRIYSEPYYDASIATGLKEGDVAKHGRMQFGTGVLNSNGSKSPTYHQSGLDSYWTTPSNSKFIRFDPTQTNFINGGVSDSLFTKLSSSDNSNINSYIAAKKSYLPNISYKIKNMLASQYRNETLSNGQRSIQSPTVQSSALIMNGSKVFDNPFNYISYVYKASKANHKYFGTRLRIIGEDNSTVDQMIQSPVGSSAYYTINGKNIGGAGGGIGVMVNPQNNSGYYFEISALTQASINTYDTTNPNLYNVFFYKVGKKTGGSSTDGVASVLYKGIIPIIVNDGSFVGQTRVYAEKNVSVYDVAIEYESKTFGYRFHLYINNKYITSIDDDAPLTNYNNMALFVRGSSQVMFENLYSFGGANKESISNGPAVLYGSPAKELSPTTDDMNRYAINSSMQSVYLKSINTSTTPSYDIYMEEFGTIMRECAYFDIKYDKAFPALQAKIAPTFNNMQGYTISGFTANAYGAQFLLFNNTDSVLTLDENSGNYLRILGITFTQQSEHVLSMDDYFAKVGDLSNPNLTSNSYVNQINNKLYSDIKASRLTYGRKEFSLNATYIQDQDTATSMMGWMVSKITKPRRSVGLQIFANPMIQLGDIVTIEYTTPDNQTVFSSSPSNSEYARFVVYSIENSRSLDGPATSLYLSEVV